MDIERLCVFCGSSTGVKPIFAEQARALGKRLAEHDIEIVYGGGAVGLMNELANAAMDHGGKVHGVITEHLLQREQRHEKLTALHVTDSMHDRKAMMAELSDAFLALPGGFGTFEELLEAITWSQLKIHSKPVILFNVDGYYDRLIDFIEHAVESGFIDEQHKEDLDIAGSVDECIDCLGILP